MQPFVVSVELAHHSQHSEVVSAIFKKGARGCAATVSENKLYGVIPADSKLSHLAGVCKMSSI